MVVDDNGKGLFTTGLRHGDALHVTDLDPSRPGLEVFGVHEIEEHTKGPGVTVYNGKTGEVYFKAADDRDVGRGVAANIDPANPGAEMWWSGSDGLYNMKGKIFLFQFFYLFEYDIGRKVEPRNFIFICLWQMCMV